MYYDIDMGGNNVLLLMNYNTDIAEYKLCL